MTRKSPCSLYVNHRLVQQLLFDVATSFTKLSILIVVCRLAVAKHSRMRWAAIIIAHIIALNMLLFLFISIFQCW